MRLSLMFATASLCTLAACSAPDTENYAGKKPDVTVKQLYGVPIGGYGVFQDRSGAVTDRYYATLVPSWQGNEGTVVEKQWNDQGKLFLQQTWHIRVDESGENFTATATQIDGDVHGETRGYAMHMTYTLLAPREDGSTLSLAGDDWTYLQPDDSAINRVSLSKLGVHVGDITYALHPLTKRETGYQGYFR